jgi:hypothetical protein
MKENKIGYKKCRQSRAERFVQLTDNGGERGEDPREALGSCAVVMVKPERPGKEAIWRKR